MKNSRVIISLLVVFLWSMKLDLSRVLFAQPVPQELRKSLDQRDARLSASTFIWKAIKHITVPKAAQEMIDTNVKKAQFDAEAYIASHKVINQSEKDRIIKDEIDLANRLGGGTDLTIEANYRFERNQKLTHISASSTSSTLAATIVSHEIHSDGAAIYYSMPGKTKEGISFSVQSPFVVGSIGNSVYKFVGNNAYAGVPPAGLALLMNINPIKLYTDEWKNVGENKGQARFTNTVYYYPNQPIHLEMTLDKDHGYAPLSIIIKDRASIVSYKTEHFQKIGEDWISDRVLYDNRDGNVVATSVWTLDRIEKTKAFAIDLPFIKPRVIDLRLKGNNLNIVELGKAHNGEDPDYVQYIWTGKLPTLDELKQMRGKQHSSATSFVAQNPAGKFLLFIPGILLIGLGVFLKLRKSKIDKKNGALPKVKAEK